MLHLCPFRVETRSDLADTDQQVVEKPKPKRGDPEGPLDSQDVVETGDATIDAYQQKCLLCITQQDSCQE